MIPTLTAAAEAHPVTARFTHARRALIAATTACALAGCATGPSGPPIASTPGACADGQPCCPPATAWDQPPPPAPALTEADFNTKTPFPKPPKKPKTAPAAP